MKSRKRTIGILLCITLLIILFSGCSKNELSSDNNSTKNGEPSDNKLTVAVSIVPEEIFVKAVCGDKINVVTMIPPGASPESYEPTPQQMVAFEKAAIYFSIGVPSEGNSILKNIADKTKLVKLEDKVSQEYKDIYIGNEKDPHIWMSPKRVIAMINSIAEEMSLLDSQNEEYYKSNADEYIKKLSKLDTDMTAMLENIKNRKFIVFHPAFNYLASDYNLEVYSLEEEGKEASAKQLQEMIDFAKAENIKVIFYQAEVDSSQSEAFAENIGGKTMMLSPLDANYIENFENMIKLIKEAMQ